eukprot:CAMPEP_0117666422 /NCGR_PEP_ID=MMETSP0804-20121206/10368_1 /TAXON_ID=1074897 /ORGANISM="Tetraselmis astigmatica, Strain CCMP880" /LENGTH=850 /DNA_ID=CAMNT_0005473967 /DNA_START=656 /DNA_END=3208 /DNA_ORIENTATION=+
MDTYTVVRKLGTGTYGSAYLVCLKGDASARYVLKKIFLQEVSQREREAAEQEVHLLATLDHAFILGYVDSFVYKNHLCIITEYCEAGDLYTYLNSRKSYLPEAQVLEWFVQIALAVQHCHDRKVLHRDLKTQNIFLTKNGDVKLGDFGISRVLKGPMEMAQTIVGTPYYMSPEILECKPYDFKSDIWSLGCVLVEMATLKHAFDASDMSGLVMKVLRGTVLPLPPHYSEQLSALANKLLSRSPRGRPSFDMIFSAEFLQDVYQKATSKALEMQTDKGRTTGEDPGLSARSDARNDRIKLEDELWHEVAQREALEETMAELQAARQPLAFPLEPSKAAASTSRPGRHPNPHRDAGEQERIDHAVQMAEDQLKKIQVERDAIRQAMGGDSMIGLRGSQEGVLHDKTAALPTFGGDGSLSNFIEGDEPTPKEASKPNYWEMYDDHYSNQPQLTSGAPPNMRSRTPVAGRRSAEKMAWGGGIATAITQSPFLGQAGLHVSPTKNIEAELEAHRERRRLGGDGLREVASDTLQPTPIHRAGRRRLSDQGDANLNHARSAGFGSSPPEHQGLRMSSYSNPADVNHHFQQRATAWGTSHFGSYKDMHSAGNDGRGEPSPDEVSKETVGGGSHIGRHGPRERMEARKLEEARKREEQLLVARKKYFEERRQAEKKNRAMYEHSNSVLPGGSYSVPDGPGSKEMTALEAEHRAVSRRIQRLQQQVQEIQSSPSGPEQPVQASHDLAGADPAARSELEAEMDIRRPAQLERQRTAELLPTHSFVRGQVSDRVTALRQICLESLGEPLFRQVYNMMKARLHGEFGNDSGDRFVKDVAMLLGRDRLHHFGLIDQLLYFEENT